MKVLVACEESQEVCKAFRALGHEAYSCDIEPCSGGSPEWHLQCDALELLKALVQTAPEDYRAYREAAFVLYGQEQQKPLKNRAKEPILYYGRLAQQYYGDRTDDEQMEQLKAMLERLQGK